MALHADVQYDATFTRTMFWPPARSTRVANTRTGVFDISPEFYSPSEAKSSKSVSHIEIKGNKMLVVHALGVRQIYDLDAKTITNIDPNKESYSVDTFDDSYAYETRIWNRTSSMEPGSGPHEIAVNKTGQTVQIGAQTAARYNIVSIRRVNVRPMVEGSLACWVIESPPLPELERFRQKWANVTKLPFPDGTLGTFGDNSSQTALKKAMNQLGGQVVRMVTENRSLPDFRGQIFALATTLSNFTIDAAPDSDFNIPSGYQEKKPSEISAR